MVNVIYQPEDPDDEGMSTNELILGLARIMGTRRAQEAKREQDRLDRKEDIEEARRYNERKTQEAREYSEEQKIKDEKRADKRRKKQIEDAPKEFAAQTDTIQGMINQARENMQDKALKAETLGPEDDARAAFFNTNEPLSEDDIEKTMTELSHRFKDMTEEEKDLYKATLKKEFEKAKQVYENRQAEMHRHLGTQPINKKLWVGKDNQGRPISYYGDEENASKFMNAYGVTLYKPTTMPKEDRILMARSDGTIFSGTHADFEREQNAQLLKPKGQRFYYVKVPTGFDKDKSIYAIVDNLGRPHGSSVGLHGDPIALQGTTESINRNLQNGSLKKVPKELYNDFFPSRKRSSKDNGFDIAVRKSQERQYAFGQKVEELMEKRAPLPFTLRDRQGTKKTQVAEILQKMDQNSELYPLVENFHNPDVLKKNARFNEAQKSLLPDAFENNPTKRERAEGQVFDTINKVTDSYILSYIDPETIPVAQPGVDGRSSASPDRLSEAEWAEWKSMTVNERIRYAKLRAATKMSELNIEDASNRDVLSSHPVTHIRQVLDTKRQFDENKAQRNLLKLPIPQSDIQAGMLAMSAVMSETDPVKKDASNKALGQALQPMYAYAMKAKAASVGPNIVLHQFEKALSPASMEDPIEEAALRNFYNEVIEMAYGIRYQPIMLKDLEQRRSASGL